MRLKEKFIHKMKFGELKQSENKLAQYHNVLLSHGVFLIHKKPFCKWRKKYRKYRTHLNSVHIRSVDFITQRIQSNQIKKKLSLILQRIGFIIEFAAWPIDAKSVARTKIIGINKFGYKSANQHLYGRFWEFPIFNATYVASQSNRCITGSFIFRFECIANAGLKPQWHRCHIGFVAEAFVSVVGLEFDAQFPQVCIRFSKIDSFFFLCFIDEVEKDEILN